jgi:hypothetical protein
LSGRDGIIGRRLISSLARSGYAARAQLYAALGILTCRCALTQQGRPDFPGAFAALHATGGSPLLIVTAIGLWGYAVWRWTEAVRNPERRSVWSRQDIAVRGALHAWLGATAARMAFVHWTEPRPVLVWVTTAFTYAFGRVVVLAAGLGLLWFACNEALLAWRGTISRHIDGRHVTRHELTAIQWVGRLGMVGRAAAFGLVAIAVLAASVRIDVAVDLADLMQALSVNTAGRLFVFLTGCALAAYGAYLAVLAFERRMPA